MKDKKLENEEIEIISQLIMELKKFPIVEGVFCVPFMSSDKVSGIKKETCNILIVYDYSAYIKEASDDDEIKMSASEQKEYIESLCEKSACKLSEEIYFDFVKVERFYPSQINSIDMAAKCELVSGKIIFDRYGKIEKFQDTLIKYGRIKQYTNLYELENIDAINFKSKK